MKHGKAQETVGSVGVCAVPLPWSWCFPSGLCPCSSANLSFSPCQNEEKRNLSLGGHVGFDSLPDQLVSKSVTQGFSFNILCVGEHSPAGTGLSWWPREAGAVFEEPCWDTASAVT